MDPRADIRQLDNKKALREFHPGGLSYYEMIDAFAFLEFRLNESVGLTLSLINDIYLFGLCI